MLALVALLDNGDNGVAFVDAIGLSQRCVRRPAARADTLRAPRAARRHDSARSPPSRARPATRLQFAAAAAADQRHRNTTAPCARDANAQPGVARNIAKP